MTGWAYIADQNICRRQTAFHAALPRQQCRTNRRLLLKPERIHHAAGVEHHDYARKCRKHPPDHVFFIEGKEIITVMRLTRAVIILS